MSRNIPMNERGLEIELISKSSHIKRPWKFDSWTTYPVGRGFISTIHKSKNLKTRLIEKTRELRKRKCRGISWQCSVTDEKSVAGENGRGSWQRSRKASALSFWYYHNQFRKQTSYYFLRYGTNDRNKGFYCSLGLISHFLFAVVKIWVAQDFSCGVYETGVTLNQHALTPNDAEQLKVKEDSTKTANNQFP